jgi:hypothetical protein
VLSRSVSLTACCASGSELARSTTTLFVSGPVRLLCDSRGIGNDNGGYGESECFPQGCLIRGDLSYSDNRMVSAATILKGLPPYGPMPTAFPREWGVLGREGTVVEFNSEEGVWVGNFQPGLGGLQFAGLHPNGLDVVVIAAGDLWIVNPRERP